MTLLRCKDCGRDVSSFAVACPHCGKPTDSAHAEPVESTAPVIIGLTGSTILFLGVFAPAVRMPTVGVQNYFQNVQGGAAVTIVLAVVAAGLTLVRRFPLLWIPAVAALGTTVFSYLSLRSNLENIQSEMQRQLQGLEDNPFQYLTDMVLNIEMLWGWAVLVLGSLVLCAAAYVGSVPEFRAPPTRMNLPR